MGRSTASLSLRERGLKCEEVSSYEYLKQVALLARAWIEIGKVVQCFSASDVALLARAWIEMNNHDKSSCSRRCRSPCESVD